MDIYLEKYMALLIGFLAICFVTQVINFEYGGVAVIGRLAYFALCILVLYSQYKSTAADYKRTLLYASRVLCSVITPALVASVIMFFFLYNGKILIRDGISVPIGVAENRLFGVFTSANVGGMYSLILIWCAVVNLYYLKKSKMRPLWIVVNAFQILVAMTYISLALSRGTYLSGAVFLLVFLVVRLPFKFEKRLNIWLQAGVRALSVVLCFAIAIGAFSVLRSGCVAIATAIADQKEEQEAPPPTPQIPNESTPAPDNTGDTDKILEDLNQGFDGRVESQSGNKDITNKRMDIWTAHLSLLKGKELFIGVNEPHIYYEVQKANGKEFTHHQFIFIDWAKGNIHNGYLQILVHCGIFALLAFVAFLAICAVRSLIFMFKKDRDSEKEKLFSLALPMVINILANNVTETNMVLMGANFFQAMFWFAAGIVVFCTVKEKKQ